MKKTLFFCFLKSVSLSSNFSEKNISCLADLKKLRKSTSCKEITHQDIENELKEHCVIDFLNEKIVDLKKTLDYLENILSRVKGITKLYKDIEQYINKKKESSIIEYLDNFLKEKEHSTLENYIKHLSEVHEEKLPSEKDVEDLECLLKVRNENNLYEKLKKIKYKVFIRDVKKEINSIDKELLTLKKLESIEHDYIAARLDRPSKYSEHHEDLKNDIKALIEIKKKEISGNKKALKYRSKSV